MYKVVILPLAKKDIKESTIWYEAKQTGLGKKFISKIKEIVSIIKKNPKIYKIRYKNTRTATFSIFPYMLHYIIDESNKTIVITAILHTRRNPEGWNKR